MRKYPLYFSLVFLLACYAGALFGQTADPKKAVLVDEYGLSTCDEIRAQLDILLSGLVDSPGSRGAIVIHGTSSNPFGPYEHRRLLAIQIDERRFDEKRIEFVKGDDEKEFRPYSKPQRTRKNSWGGWTAFVLPPSL